MMGGATQEWEQRRIMVVVAALMATAWDVIEPNLAGLTDDEYFWEPAANCWGVRRRGQQKAPDCWGKGEWVVETCLDGSVQPDMTTIGWRLMHAYDCTNDFTSRAFGHGGVDWNEIEVAGTADGAVELMTQAVQRLRGHLDHADDAVLLGTGDHDDPRPRWLLLDKAVQEVVHHTAEVGVLRQMFRCA